jgi:hypothetical protein
MPDREARQDRFRFTEHGVKLALGTACPIDGDDPDPRLILIVQGVEVTLDLDEAEDLAVQIVRAVGEVRTDTAALRFFREGVGLNADAALAMLHGITETRKALFNPAEQDLPIGPDDPTLN